MIGDSDKLRFLASWFDKRDASLKVCEFSHHDVQTDLRRMADEMDRKDALIADAFSPLWNNVRDNYSDLNSHK